MTDIVLRLRIKDRRAKWLSECAREANLVWNYCNELSQKVWQRERRFLSGFDFWPFLKGVTKAGLALPVQTVQEIAEQYAVKRRAARKTRLSWRKSGGVRRSLGWLPFKVRTIRYAHGQVYYAGRWLSLWDSYGLGGFELRAGSISEDARGRWYLNVCVERPDFVGPRPIPSIDESVGIDLGLKDLAALSNGHKEAARTRMAKSVLDAGWSSLRTMLRYKCAHAGVWFEEVDEAFSSQTCSSCGALPPERPKGIAGLGIREWACSGCGTMHDRDVNAARNILAVGHGHLGAGIFHPQVREDVNVHPHRWCVSVARRATARVPRQVPWSTRRERGS